MKLRTLPLACLAAVAVVACDSDTEPVPADPAASLAPADTPTGNATDDDASADPPADAEEEGPASERLRLRPVGVCAYISSDDVSRITSQTYDVALSAAAYPDLAHCEYRLGRASIAMKIASGVAAEELMAKAKLGPVQAVDDVKGGDALWAATTGQLNVLADGRCAEVIISPNHPDPDKHFDYAKALVALLWTRAPEPVAEPAPNLESEPVRESAPTPGAAP